MIQEITEIVCALLVLISAILTLDKNTRTLLKNKQVQRATLALSLVLFLLWSIYAGLLNGLNIHILGMTAVTLIVGLRLALFCGLVALIPYLALTKSYDFIASFSLFTIVIPALFSYFVFYLSYHYLARHLFIYIFVCGFLTAGFSAVVHMVLMTAYHLLIGHYTWYQLTENYTFYAALIWFPESMLTGMAMTVLIIYRPHWVRTFYDNQY